MRLSSSSTSPGRTWVRNLASLIAAKKPSLPRFSGRDSMATAATWASASTISTPGSTWYCGKCPQKTGLMPLTHRRPRAQEPSSPSVMRSTSAKG